MSKVLDIRRVGDYRVVVDDRTTAWGTVRHLEVSRVDNKPIHKWRDLQRVKNELCGEHRLAIEVYPATDRLVDEQNAYHLWVLPEGFELPFGIHEGDNIDRD